MATTKHSFNHHPWVLNPEEGNKRNANVDDFARAVKRASIVMAIASTIMLIIWIVKRGELSSHTTNSVLYLSLAIPIFTLIMASFCNISATRKSFKLALLAMCFSILLLGLHCLNLILAITTHSIPLVITMDFLVILFRILLSVILYKFIMELHHSPLFARLSPSSSDPLSFSDSSSPSFVLTSSLSSSSSSDQANTRLVADPE